jgi:5-methyltetrahydropteroyltriglutamate--homocysteine methyltransferase
MPARSTPPFRADHVGSLLRPPALLAAREKRAKGEIDAAALRKAEDAAIADAVRLQENLGLKGVTDGEFRRTYWHLDFIERIEGVKLGEGTARFQFKGNAFRPAVPTTVGKLRHPGTIMGEDFAYLKSVARATAKVCAPSPTTVYFRAGRAGVSAAAYPDIAAYFADLAAVYRAEIADLAKRGCRYFQLDEVNFAYLCDDKQRAAVTAIGEDLKTLPMTLARLINDSIRGRPKDMAVTMHVCRGNFKGAWMAEGGYEPVAEALFACDVDGFFLEYDDERSGGFAPLRLAPKNRMIVLGLVTSKRGDLEAKDALKRRIDEAAKYVPIEWLALSPQCGFSSTVEGNPVTMDDQKRKLALCVEVAHEVWGGV